MLLDLRDAPKLADFSSAARSHEGGSVEGAMRMRYYDALEELMGRENGEVVDMRSASLEALLRGNLRFPVRDGLYKDTSEFPTRAFCGHLHSLHLKNCNFCETDDHLSLVLELCEHDALYDRILSRKALTDPVATACMVQILCALTHCYCLSIVNRDVKPEDVLFDSRDVPKLVRGADAVGVWRGGGHVEGWGGVVHDDRGVATVPGQVSLGGFRGCAEGEPEVPGESLYNILAVAKEFLSKMICRDVSRRISAEQALSERFEWTSLNPQWRRDCRVA
ncbi:phosphoenolpyruvate carboxylase kinase 1-like [Eucalyptus grandis]|uniref:phosphoenolpyruvate carboxylase kinase 1-like n=1 Tax=Eucalyptus grandis TaxID=71139 RepID=UPI00192EEFD4|nr:phosphoenolpyruvate carboxylase kinase 1-like [Eucalyptus grandis]